MRWVIYAIALRLFGRGKYPRRLLWTRCASGLLFLAVISVLAYRFTPSGRWLAGYYSLPTIVAVLCLALYVFMGLLHVIFFVQQRSFLSRLALLSNWPLSCGSFRIIHAMAYLPLGLLGAALALPVALRLCWPALGWWTVVAAAGAYAASAVLHFSISTAKGGYIQLFRVGTTILASAGIWGMVVRGQQSFFWQMLPLLLFVSGAGMVRYLWNRPVKSYERHAALRVSEHAGLGTMGGFCLRAVRSRRYLTANAIVFGIFILLALGAWRSKGVPFEAAAAITLLLAGIIAQEVRSLSNRLYPQELLAYGLVLRWSMGNWILLFTNTAIIIDVILGVSRWLFPGQLGLGTVEMACFGFAMAAVGALVIAPNKDDIFGQLKAVFFYGAGIWLILKCFAIVEGGTVVTALATLSFVAACFTLTCMIENWRWVRTIYTS
jgi:hypothetical protein